MKRTADRLFGDQYVWSVLAAGKHQMPLITQAAMLGGNVRVGLEDSLYIGRGAMAKSNADLKKLLYDMLAKLVANQNEIIKLLKTPEGRRPGWGTAGY